MRRQAGTERLSPVPNRGRSLSPDYSSVLEVLPEAHPNELLSLLHDAAAPLEARDLGLYLADYQGVALLPVLVDQSIAATLVEEDIASTMAGRAYRTGETTTAERADGFRVWTPLVERGERTGVLAMTLPKLDDHLVAQCIHLGRFAGLLVRSFARTTDILHLARRRRSMHLAAGMQWDLLPPLTLNSANVTASGRLEPAYEVAGDAFDYAMNEEYLHVAVFDGMGHGVDSTLMTTLAVGAYRHARRAGVPLSEIHAEVDRAIAEQYEHRMCFVTATFARLALDGGRLEWCTAGHPTPLLLREHRVVRQLSCLPSLPLGLGGQSREVASEQLEPGDSVLFFTDGVVEGRSQSGEEFGVGRLSERWEHHSASHLQPDEVLRRLIEDVMAYSAGKLRDDASLAVVHWRGSSRDQP